MSKMIYPADSKELHGFLIRVSERIDAELESKQVRILDTLEIPKKWGGYEIPLKMSELSAAGLRECYADLIQSFNDSDYQNLVKHVIKDSRKQPTIIIGGALVSRCKKSRRPGVLIYWSR